VRVIGGTSRGRALRAPRGKAIRPTSDRVREAIFNILASLVDLDGASVADLFAGTGAMGIEALSRGASAVVFVDQEPSAVDAIRANLGSVGLDDDRAKVVRAEVAGWLERRRAGLRERSPHDAGPFDVALVDPPYAFGAWDRVLGALEARFAVLESNHPIELAEDRARWEVVRSRRYGDTLVTVVRASRCGDDPQAKNQGGTQ
jgi:16S rRNA (guanine966-N2)-methyltransferase